MGEGGEEEGLGGEVADCYRGGVGFCEAWGLGREEEVLGEEGGALDCEEGYVELFCVGRRHSYGEIGEGDEDRREGEICRGSGRDLRNLNTYFH